MVGTIRFPHLGLVFEQVRSGFSVFGFEISYFGLLLGMGMLAGLGITLLIASYTRQDINGYLYMMFWITIFSIAGGRLYYVIARWDYYGDHLGEILQIRKGGLGFYGALLAGIIPVFIYAWRQKISAGKILDTCAIGLAAGQAISAWGSFFVEENFGEYTDSFFAMQLPVRNVLLSAITDKMKNHIEVIDGERYVQVNPLFLWTSLWCMVVILILIFFHTRKKFAGEIFLVYLTAYSFGCFWLEGVRADALYFQHTGFKISRIVAAIMVVASVGMIIYQLEQSDKARMKRVKEKEARKFSRISKKEMYLK